MVTSGPKLLLIALTRPMILMQLVSVLVSFAHVTTGDHVIQVFNRELKYKGLTNLALPLTDMGRVIPLTRVLTPSLANPGIMDQMILAEENCPWRRTVPALHRREVVSVAGTDQLRCHPDTNPGSGAMTMVYMSWATMRCPGRFCEVHC